MTLISEQKLLPGRFTAERSRFFGILFLGYIAMLPTLGLYRFWLLTRKRQFYWMNSDINGHPLEYTGTPLEVMRGFFAIVALFLPAYTLSIFIALQSDLVRNTGLGVLFALFWYFSGYAIYRGRAYRLSHTYWRGIRFGQTGSAWRYAARRFLWSLLVVATLGLAYPFMVGDLWRYRWSRTWYGDRLFTFAGGWRTVAGPFYRAYAGAIVGTGVAFGAALPFAASLFWTASFYGLVALFSLLPLLLAFTYYRAREVTRCYSAIRLGEATVAVDLGARRLFGQYFVFALLCVGSFFILSLSFTFFVLNSGTDYAFVASALPLAIIILYSFWMELIVDFGFWSRIAAGAIFTNLDSLRDTNHREDSADARGEGLADALNVGAF